jgi:methionine synthase I (cobalamin-dependent)
MDRSTLPPLEAHPFLDALRDRVVVFDGAMGTSLQAAGLTSDDFGGDDLEGCNEVLVRTRPDVIEQIHRDFLEVGCDAVETDTFGGAPWVLAEYGLQDDTEELNRLAAEVARRACDAYTTPERPRWVVGSIGPGTRSPTLSLGKDPAATKDFIDVAMMEDGYRRQVRGLLDGGTDILLIETCFDLLQIKAAVAACNDVFAERGARVPLMVSFVLVSAFMNLFIGSASAKWAIMSPVFVPMFMFLGYSPELTQAAYRIGDSVTNIITPMMSYFGLILAFANKYDKDLGIGTIISMMLPYSIFFFVGWMGLFYLWVFGLGLPVGPEAPTYYMFPE